MRHLVDRAGLADRVALDSAGTGHWHVGEPADPRSRAAAVKRGVEISHRARQFVAADFDRFDLVVAMDRENYAALRQMIGDRATPELRLLRSFDPAAGEAAEVPDPYSGGPAGFEEVLDLCERACQGLIAHIRGRLSTAPAAGPVTGIA